MVLSVIDLKTFHLKEGYIPAVLTTCFLVVSFIVAGPQGLFTGALGFLIGMLLVDLDLFHGVADWKVFVACSFVLPSIAHVGIFGFFTTLTAVGYQFLIKKSDKKAKEIPFIPALLIAYVVTLGVILL